jgi:hypothetical protein
VRTRSSCGSSPCGFQLGALSFLGGGAQEGHGRAHQRPWLDPLHHAGHGAAKRDATQNLRYKFGEDLRAERPEQALLFPNEDALRLPRRGLGANTLLAVGNTFFVYPTKLREYQSRYRGSFLHGGVPEEVSCRSHS